MLPTMLSANSLTLICQHSRSTLAICDRDADPSRSAPTSCRARECGWGTVLGIGPLICRERPAAESLRISLCLCKIIDEHFFASPSYVVSAAQDVAEASPVSQHCTVIPGYR